MTRRFLLDTGVVTAPVSKAPSSAVMRRLENHGHECAIAAPVWHELICGGRGLPKGVRREAFAAYLNDVVKVSFPILAYDEAAATWHGGERARLERLGQAGAVLDGQIAAIAYVNGLTLVTSHVKDFTRFKGLTVLSWDR